MAGDLKDFQRGAEFASAILVGIYSCLIVVTLWRPTGTGRLTVVGWIIIAVYCLTLCRAGRTLSMSAGDSGTMGSADYVLCGIRHGFLFTATVLSDSLFCWRLYVIWSRSIRIVLLPASLLVLNALSLVTIVIIDFLTARRPNDARLLALNYPLFVAVQIAIVVYTCYIAGFITSRLWLVGHAVDRIISPERPKRNRYLGAISALLQPGVIQSATRIVTIIVAIVDYSLIPTIDRIVMPLNGISTTLLFLQLNIFQQKTPDQEAPPLTTGATFEFASRDDSSSTASGDWAGPPAARRRRASMSMAACQPRESVTNTQAPGPLIMFPQHKRSRLPLPDNSTTSTVSTNNEY